MKKNKMVFYLLYFLVGSLLAQDASHSLWYKQPAKKWMTEALPLGNGRLGAMIFGGINQERLQLNVDSLWTGDERDTGAYQNLGNLYITFDKEVKATDYKRTLDLRQAVHKVEFKAGENTYKRECFSSAADQVIVLHISGKKLSGRIKLEDGLGKNRFERSKDKKSRKESEVKASAKAIIMQGRLVNDLRYAAQLQAKCKGGSITVSGNELIFKNVDELTLLLAAETNYVMDMKKNWRGEDPLLKVQRTLKLAQAKGLKKLRTDHIEEYKGFFDRFTFDIGTSATDRATLATDERLKLFQKDEETGRDPDFRELIINYARYLLISSSRPGCLPANLQGIWCDNNSPSWRSDYHSNINIQMNYWFALPMNLADCHQVFCDYVMAIRQPRLKAKDIRLPTGAYHKKGWAVKTENNIFGGTGWSWNVPGVAWYAQHLYEQYSFTQDRQVLKNQAYVVLKETCEFWEERLKTRPDGTLVVHRGWSPEHGPVEDGVTYDQMIVHDLFSNYIDVATELAVDKEYVAKIKDMRQRLLAPKVGKWGQLQEWETDRDDPQNHHRHVSHLFGVHPGRQIIPGRDKKLVQAAITSLNGRGDGGTGWSKAWKISFWARLRDGDRAYKLMTEHLRKNFYTNLFDAHPPFQIDGNFGHAAGVAECLLQSHLRQSKGKGKGLRVIELLPSLPSQWSKGKVTGLLARGGVTVDITWEEGRVKLARLVAVKDITVILKSAKTEKVLILKKGKAVFYQP